MGWSKGEHIVLLLVLIHEVMLTSADIVMNLMGKVSLQMFSLINPVLRTLNIDRTNLPSYGSLFLLPLNKICNSQKGIINIIGLVESKL